MITPGVAGTMCRRSGSAVVHIAQLRGGSDGETDVAKRRCRFLLCPCTANTDDY